MRPTGEPGGPREAAAARDRTAPGRCAGPCRGGLCRRGPALRAPMETGVSPAWAAWVACAPGARPPLEAEHIAAAAAGAPDRGRPRGGRVWNEPVDLSPPRRSHSPALVRSQHERPPALRRQPARPGLHRLDVMKRAFSRVAPPSAKDDSTVSRDVRKSRIERSRPRGLWRLVGRASTGPRADARGGSQGEAPRAVRVSRLGVVDGPREWRAVLVRTRTQGSGMVRPAGAVTRTRSRAAGWLMGS